MIILYNYKHNILYNNVSILYIYINIIFNVIIKIKYIVNYKCID